VWVAVVVVVHASWWCMARLDMKPVFTPSQGGQPPTTTAAAAAAAAAAATASKQASK
jgi:hypothetical protein